MMQHGWLDRSAILTGLKCLALSSLPVYGSVWTIRDGIRRMLTRASLARASWNYIKACIQATFFLVWFVLFPPLNPFWSAPAQANAAPQPGIILIIVAFVVFAFWTYFGIPSVLLLYLISAQMLIAARRFDLGFQWLSHRFDIEKKPLQSIGLVAGVLVAMIYWAAVIVSRIVG
jgi:hypothetical protein